MIMKTLTAGAVALTLSFTSLAPTQASADISGDDALTGIIALLFLGAAIRAADNNDNGAAVHHAPPPQPQLRRDWRVLPANCLRNITRRNGNTIRMFPQRCLNNNYAYVNHLPQACHVRVNTENGQRRQGFRARCLRNQGFRINRR